LSRRGMRTIAKQIEACFQENERAAGRALLRRKRVVAKGAGPWFDVRVRAHEGELDVVVSADARGIAMSCPCDRFATRGSCGHAWAAVLAIDQIAARNARTAATPAPGNTSSAE